MIIAANWKMHFSPSMAQQYFDAWKQLTSSEGGDQEVGPHSSPLFFVPACNWHVAQLNGLQWGPQNFFPDESGAFTGENSPLVAKEMGAQWALIGHSERRQLFNEENYFINKKILKSLQLGLKPLLCIGETLEQRQSGSIESVLRGQLQQSLLNVTPNLNLHIAYEPIWAIGTGLTARLEDIDTTHRLIQNILEDLGFSKSTPILYGGSVKPDNSSEILSVKTVSGLLVGGASLKPDSFYKILTL